MDTKVALLGVDRCVLLGVKVPLKMDIYIYTSNSFGTKPLFFFCTVPPPGQTPTSKAPKAKRLEAGRRWAPCHLKPSSCCGKEKGWLLKTSILKVFFDVFFFFFFFPTLEFLLLLLFDNKISSLKAIHMNALKF